MPRALVTIRGSADRALVTAWASQVPDGTRVEFKSSKRSIPQNDRMWAMLTDVARQLEWHGHKLTPDDWKLMFLDALKREARMIPNIEGDGFVSLGRSSSDLSRDEMTDLIEIMFAFGAKHGVKFQDEAERKTA